MTRTVFFRTIDEMYDFIDAIIENSRHEIYYEKWFENGGVWLMWEPLM